MQKTANHFYSNFHGFSSVVSLCMFTKLNSEHIALVIHAQLKKHKWLWNDFTINIFVHAEKNKSSVLATRLQLHIVVIHSSMKNLFLMARIYTGLHINECMHTHTYTHACTITDCWEPHKLKLQVTSNTFP